LFEKRVIAISPFFLSLIQGILRLKYKESKLSLSFNTIPGFNHTNWRCFGLIFASLLNHEKVSALWLFAGSQVLYLPGPTAR
jgi:hypothetical protein